MSLALRLGAEAGGRLAGGMDPDLARVEHLEAEDVEVVREGPAPTISVKLEMPMPISSPRARFSACSARSPA